jgi:hypothetical protein
MKQLIFVFAALFTACFVIGFSCNIKNSKTVIVKAPEHSPLTCPDSIVAIAVGFEAVHGFKPEHFNCVKHISLTVNDTIVPWEVLQCTNLEKLSLPQCFNLKSIPHEIGQLKRLKSLVIFHAPIDSLPSALFELDSLKRLDAAFCNLVAMPNNFCKSKSLKSVNFRGNMIKTISECVFTMSNLKDLIIRNSDVPIEGEHLDVLKRQAASMPKGFNFEY